MLSVDSCMSIACFKKILLLVFCLLTALDTIAQTYTGVLSTSSTRFDSPDPNGNNPPIGYSRGTYYYQLFAVHVTTAGSYTFRGTTNFLYGSEGILYKDPGPVADASTTVGASIQNALMAVGSGQPDFTLTKTLSVGQYYFAVSTYAEKITGDFTLTITGPSPLPVQLNSFTATTQAVGVKLAWTTASEVNNALFRIERSLDSQHWLGLAQIPGKGTTLQKQAYSWLDVTTPNGKVYYRLQQTDTDGQIRYSPVVSIVTTVSKIEFFPNPVLDHVTFICPNETTLTISDAIGRVWQPLHLRGGYQQVVLDSLPVGIYWLTNQTTHQVMRLVKSNP